MEFVDDLSHRNEEMPAGTCGHRPALYQRTVASPAQMGAGLRDSAAPLMS